ncbi:MFS transporter [Pseudomonas gingeri]|uniref:MFS transporter n=1 Tax=Pseudomonas gingeri TaxID=117681 RepID=UPI0015A46146|nr:MFS transporter [Pseudomonas gingeri]NVZ99022.1 MFS transporter [Pseudomonas gingeri]NWA13067.1 MFS transporter [Pseudomonas gingeri]NWA55328.1 MFS transporter [Pseudomonas gingeri]NWA95818.1 MFS transporter [Pseudomonas gingeri]NWB00906.1 MFS transporter [Pseudomonas gingeri]
MLSPLPPPPVAVPFDRRLIIGLVGVLIAALTSGINDRVTELALADVLGVFGIGHDEGTWISALYAAAEVSAMLIAPWLAVTFSLRRFAMAMTLAFSFFGVLCPLAPNLDVLLLLRVLQGLAGGALPPLLMTVALRFLPWHYKLYGLSAYALTATFGPNISLPLAAAWTENLDWRLVFWQIAPFGLLATAFIAYGIPQDPLRLERFKQADWRGALLGCGGLAMLVIGLMQGERLDWLESPLICLLLAGAAICLPLFLLNEWFHPLPLFKVQLLERRNFAYGIATLALFVMVSLSAVALPANYLGHIQDYRAAQTMPLALLIALPQLLLAPMVATVINRNWVDSRYVIACGLGLITLACLGGSHLTGAWVREDFYALQLLQTLGQPMIVVPLLMTATGVIQPMEGPFASAIVNSIRGLASVIGTVLLENFITARQHQHSNVLVDQWSSSQLALAPLLEEQPITAMAGRLREQAFILSFSDAFLAIIGLIAILAILLLTLPTRPFPPQPPKMP